jgi:hypothetical protein
MGPPPRSLAAEANGCFMVRVRHGPNRIQGCGARDAPDSGLPSDQSKHASTIGEQSDATKLDTDIPIQGCSLIGALQSSIPEVDVLAGVTVLFGVGSMSPHHGCQG